MVAKIECVLLSALVGGVPDAGGLLLVGHAFLGAFALMFVPSAADRGGCVQEPGALVAGAAPVRCAQDEPFSSPRDVQVPVFAVLRSPLLDRQG